MTHCICAKLQPFQLLCRHTSNLQHITYILQCFGPSAVPRAYAHYISPHIVHPSLTDCISAKVSSSSTCRHTYSMQHINYIFGRLWAFGWSKRICTLYRFLYSTSFIDPLHICKGGPIWHSVGTYTVCSIFIISLQSLTLWLVQEQTNTIYCKIS